MSKQKSLLMQENIKIEAQYPSTNMDRVELEFIFKADTYKEIRKDRAFNIESLVGNVGGYIGLFLGFAIWSIPELFPNIKCFKILKNWF